MDELSLVKKQLEKYKKEIEQLENAKDDVLAKCTILDIILDALPHPFYVVDANTHVIRIANKSAMRGFPPGEHKCYSITHQRATPCSGGEHPCPLDEVKRTKKPVVIEHIHYNADGKPIFVEVYGYPILDDKGDVIEMIEYSIDITKRKQAEQKITHLATHDQLTGLPNRTLFNIRLDLELSHAQRNQDKIAVMLLDLDGFKKVNDDYGHTAGDCLLRSVGERLRAVIRKSDTLARMGGDEFLVLLPHLHEKQEALGVANKFIKLLQSQFECEKHLVQVNTSIGVAFFPDDSSNSEDLIRMADIAMYAAKKVKGGCYKRYEEISGTK